ncbi:30S ribosomal protein S4 [Candidatus Curtissbacteria bacterium RIFCSPHIGHO2_12_FULL_38_9b]|uniref:Small ribosomal subunit protein uS4 n=2 Tax=Candidatus Curtissiibacteriota TaxID=1752717 RepID=A0A1F5GXA3_9BACT|nr:MAG: 30S ribosomal protein S4 [Candidatus Curtissbacteria bacterium RIFCSPLOWO2_01_FULL_37_9]OGD96550.1 MAG: 30S ribosomal protein S4 [Candidatus Curtissbacteria bacterium RIFCSPHIGHO2_12_FULL_38_9b]
MARYTGPKHHLCKAEGIALCGSVKCPVIRKNAGLPGQHGSKRRRKQSEYGMQLREKQKVKRMYGVLERQFQKYYTIASRAKKATGEVLLQILETRLDNVIFRLKLAKSRAQARQLVSHGHVLVDNKVVTIPSFNVKLGSVISLSAQAANLDFIKKLIEETKNEILPSWLSKKVTVGKISKVPKREDITEEIDERLIVEYYSR